MTDDLRDRIAAVLYRQHYRYGNPDDIAWDELETDLQDRYLADADAVIAELETDYVLVPKSHTIATAVTGRRDCNPHPDAPHGFDRNASHDEGRNVCDCERWSPPDEDDPYEAIADAERQQWADDEGIPR